MKKTILILSFIGFLVVSCGEKKPEKAEEVVIENSDQSDNAVSLKHTMQWTAFKTPAKVGVKGTFDKISLTGVGTEATLEESLKGAAFEIEVNTLNTGDAGRDSKLKDYFFDKMKGNITGSFGEFKDGKVAILITMNGVTKEKEFTYQATDDSIEIKGAIDIIADFAASDAFQSLHEICKDLHEGKSWTEVELDIKIEK